MLVHLILLSSINWEEKDIENAHSEKSPYKISKIFRNPKSKQSNVSLKVSYGKIKKRKSTKVKNENSEEMGKFLLPNAGSSKNK